MLTKNASPKTYKNMDVQKNIAKVMKIKKLYKILPYFINLI
jgi:hypothetical protein